MFYTVRARRQHCGSLREMFSHFSSKWLFSESRFPISCTSPLCEFNLVCVCFACLWMKCGIVLTICCIRCIPYICFAVKERNEINLIVFISDMSLCKSSYLLTVLQMTTKRWFNTLSQCLGNARADFSVIL